MRSSDTGSGWFGVRLSRPFTDSLSDTDKISQPLFRFFANYIATKTSSLSELEIARLTTAEISSLISRLPEPEINRLLNAGLSDLFDGVTHYLTMFVAGCFGLTLLSCGYFIFQGWRWKRRLSSSQRRHAVIFFANVAVQTGVLGNPFEFCFVQRICQLQEVEQNQEGTYGDVISSTGSTVDVPESQP